MTKFTDLFMETATTPSISIAAIERIESGGNANAINKRSGARGALQILNKKIWDYIVKDMGVDWDWDTQWNIKEISRGVGNHYFNTIIPRYLRTYKIPDTIESRIATYNWGIGNVKRSYRKHKENWLKHLPSETSKYLNKYYALTGTAPATPVVAPVTAPKAPVAAKPAEPKKPAEPVVHIVKSGDTISHIAKRYKIKLEKIKELNPGIVNLNKISIGQKIRVA